ncbi:hypothetical protein ACFL0V_03750 [Nanoarchaeota archaeon]
MGLINWMKEGRFRGILEKLATVYRTSYPEVRSDDILMSNFYYAVGNQTFQGEIFKKWTEKYDSKMRTLKKYLEEALQEIARLRSKNMAEEDLAKLEGELELYKDMIRLYPDSMKRFKYLISQDEHRNSMFKRGLQVRQKGR